MKNVNYSYTAIFIFAIIAPNMAFANAANNAIIMSCLNDLETKWDKGNTKLRAFYQYVEQFTQINPDEKCQASKNSDYAQDCSDLWKSVKDSGETLEGIIAKGCQEVSSVYASNTCPDGQYNCQSVVKDVNEIKVKRTSQVHQELGRAIETLKKLEQSGADSANKMISDLDNIKQKAHGQTAETADPTAKGMGGATPKSAMDYNGWQDTAQARQMVDKFQNSGISNSELSQLQSPILNEQLSGAQSAKNLRTFTEEWRSNTASDNVAATNTVNATKSEMSKLGALDGANSPTNNASSGVASSNGSNSWLNAAAAGAPAAGALAGGQQGGSGSTGSLPGGSAAGANAGAVTKNYGTQSGLFDSGSSPQSNALSIASDEQEKLTKQLTNASIDPDSTYAQGTSRLSNDTSLRDSLKSKLAKRSQVSSSGSGEGSFADSTVAGASSSAKRKSGSSTGDLDESIADDVSRSLASGDLGTTNLSLAGAETDAMVNDMLKELQGEDTTQDSSTPYMSAASAKEWQEAAPEIGDQESASLFSRLREFHARCQKRGCVVILNKSNI